MPKSLTDVQVARYRRDGFYFPLPVLSAAEAEAYRDRLQAQERALGGALSGNTHHKVHLLFTWANELTRHPAILDAVEDIIGPDTTCCWCTGPAPIRPATGESASPSATSSPT